MTRLRPSTQAIGNHFEQQACQLLQEAGYVIVATNYRIPKVGEIDIIAYADGTLVAVEVKARRQSGFGMAVERVTLVKQKKIIRTMLYFLQDERHQRYANAYVRFDVIGFDKGVPLWLQGAFLGE